MHEPGKSGIIFRTLRRTGGPGGKLQMTAIVLFLIRLDHSVFKAINSLAGKSTVLDWIARLGADDHVIPIVLVLLVLLLLLIAKNRRDREAALTCIICTLLAVILSMVILFAFNAAFFRPRPFTSYSSVHMLFYHNTDSAFPSNAATLAFVLAFSVVIFDRKVGAVMLVLAGFVGLARIVVGVHYPLDIIGGALLGLSSALIARAAEPIYRPLARRLNSATDRLLASWKHAPGLQPRGGRRA
jgi:undecaprenyl-diphosphatase